MSDRTLLSCFPSPQNYDRVMELKKQFDELGYEPTGAIFACIINMCCNMEKFSEAVEMKENL